MRDEDLRKSEHVYDTSGKGKVLNKSSSYLKNLQYKILNEYITSPKEFEQIFMSLERI